MGLKTGDPLQEDTLEGTFDVHPVDDEGHSALAMMVLARYYLGYSSSFIVYMSLK